MLPPWAEEIKKILESTPRKKFCREARVELEVSKEALEKGYMTELEYWKDIRDILHNFGIIDLMMPPGLVEALNKL